MHMMPTHLKEVLSDEVTHIVHVCLKGIPRSIVIHMEFGDGLVTSPYRQFTGIVIIIRVATRETEIGEVIFHRSRRPRIALGGAGHVASSTICLGMIHIRIHGGSVHHHIESHHVPGDIDEKSTNDGRAMGNEPMGDVVLVDILKTLHWRREMGPKTREKRYSTVPRRPVYKTQWLLRQSRIAAPCTV